MSRIPQEAKDIQAFDQAMAELAPGADETVPLEVAHRLLSAEEHPVRV
ncbi:hypothetical protein [Thiohalorhabdus methylotrophus]|uniref:Uncharacterized protein n=1 Tax=Thiohalorhabdus methylotrophus TaxID=3242694 RepID=A0ABV4TYU3_9GAMM